MEDIKLKKRLLDLSYKYKLSHLGSYFSSLGIIDEIFDTKKDEDIFILSSGHCAMALYAVLEKYQGIDAAMLFEKHGGHPHRDEENGLYCSTGSLGLGLPIATGRAIAEPNRDVYCLISDGECAEGSIWESLSYINEQNITNIKVYVNINGTAAYKEINVLYLANRLQTFLPSINLRYTTVEHFPFLRGLNAHYHIMRDEDYQQGKELLENR